MKRMILLFNVFINISLSSQNNLLIKEEKNFLEYYLEEEQKRGVVNVILSAYSCGNCWCPFEGVYECFIFTKDTLEIYRVRYLRYTQGPNIRKVIEDMSFIDSDIKNIFTIEEMYHDTIIWELSNINKLLGKRVGKNGEILYVDFSDDISKKHFAIISRGQKVYANFVMLSINRLYENTYYYWLLNGAINNYIYEILRPQIELERKLRHKKK